MDLPGAAVAERAVPVTEEIPVEAAGSGTLSVETVRVKLSEASMVVGAMVLSDPAYSEAAGAEALSETVATSAVAVTTAVSEVVTATSEVD